MSEVRDKAIAKLQALGVKVTKSGDVSELKQAILRTVKPQRVFSEKAQCKNKLKYTTLDEAIKAARRADIPSLQQYLCPHCKRWHNGNPVKR